MLCLFYNTASQLRMTNIILIIVKVYFILTILANETKYLYYNNLRTMSTISFLTRGSPPVRRILVIPSFTNSSDNLRTSSVPSRRSLGVRSTPPSGMQYWPEHGISCLCEYLYSDIHSNSIGYIDLNSVVFISIKF